MTLLQAQAQYGVDALGDRTADLLDRRDRAGPRPAAGRGTAVRAAGDEPVIIGVDGLDADMSAFLSAVAASPPLADLILKADPAPPDFIGLLDERCTGADDILALRALKRPRALPAPVGPEPNSSALR
jgi:hypothetical protein